jgi:hypothetical protein
VKINPPPWLRATLYIATAVGTPVVLYAQAKGWIGDLELTLWGAEVTVVSALAGFNVTNTAAPEIPAGTEVGEGE